MDAQGVAHLLREQWGLGPIHVSPLGGGMNSATWSVADRRDRWVAKMVSPADLGQLERGCVVAARLSAAGLRTGSPRPTLSGRLVAADPAVALLEFVPGRALVGREVGDQRAMARMVASVHRLGTPTPGTLTGDFFPWLQPRASGVAAHPWLMTAVESVRAECRPLATTWSTLHSDPAPEAFLRDAGGVVGLIDWTGAQPGPVLYDLASAVMYLGGTRRAAAFLQEYRACHPLTIGEWALLDAFRRFRWVVQGVYFAGRLAAGDLTGIGGPDENLRGLDDARRGLRALGVPVDP